MVDLLRLGLLLDLLLRLRRERVLTARVSSSSEDNCNLTESLELDDMVDLFRLGLLLDRLWLCRCERSLNTS